MKVEKFEASRGHRLWLASGVFAIVAGFLAVFAAMPATAGTLDRIRDSGRLKLGYLVDQRPFSYRNEAGEPKAMASTCAGRLRPRSRRRCPAWPSTGCR